ncbi:hypothetical protein GJ697_23065 [Pseudoduganella sp. FT25W]|uniref:Uncharacterized protein n=1 Tax=Duganella alba TaxID=2666081 RepID=A0A6L5QMP3_9BURK|nr:hypothetical protein [Duganella alba]MRX10718.1 hypothetical protein [Duganella alba]MRX18640.1 hypothetical protein [Duganella alba]
MLTSYLAQLQSNPGWVAINVLVPVLLPFVVIVAVAVATGGWRDFVQMFTKSIDGGQLFWVALGLLASTGYEAFTAYGCDTEQQEYLSWVLGLCVVGAFFCSIYIALNTIQTAQKQKIRKTVILISVLMTATMCYCYPFIHFKLPRC